MCSPLVVKMKSLTSAGVHLKIKTVSGLFGYTEACVSCRYVNSTKKGKVRIFSMPYENNFQR